MLARFWTHAEQHYRTLTEARAKELEQSNLAFRPLKQLYGEKAHRCHPHQLRHNYATRIRKDFGLEAAQILLGHSKADVTQIYAERDMNRAATVAAKIG